MGDYLGTQTKRSIYRRVVNLWRWLVRQVVQYMLHTTKVTERETLATYDDLIL